MDAQGIRDIKGLYGLPHLAINLWTIGVFTLGATIINLPLGFIEHSSTPIWIAVCANFCFITFFVSRIAKFRRPNSALTPPFRSQTLYLWGIFFQELDFGQTWWKIPIHLLCAIIIQRELSFGRFLGFPLSAGLTFTPPAAFASIAEGLSAIWAMASEDFGKVRYCRTGHLEARIADFAFLPNSAHLRHPRLRFPSTHSSVSRDPSILMEKPTWR